MTATAAPAPAHRDNLFGICHATAQTFGFDPLLLRIALLIGLLVDFETAVATYAAMGVAVLTAALLAPAPRAATAA